MRKLIFFTLIILVILTIKYYLSDDRLIPVGFDGSYQLSPSEEEVELTSGLVDYFYDVCKAEGEDLVVNKLIEGEKYQYLFVSLSFKDDCERTIQLIKQDAEMDLINHNIEEYNNNRISNFLLYKEHCFQYRAMFKEDSGHGKIVFSFTDSDSLKVARLFKNHKFLINQYQKTSETSRGDDGNKSKDN